MVDDPHADTRYNAAIALAQHGNVAAIPTLAEMLDPDGDDERQRGAERPGPILSSGR